MTAEQLDEIEKLAEAATPGPWLDDVGVNVEKPSFYGDWYAEWYACAPGHESKQFDSDGEPILDTKAQKQAETDARFIVVMRRCALPLVKALREAREEWAYEWEQRHQMEVKLLATEAEVERLRAALRMLFEEAQDKCAIRDDTTDAVEAALKEVEP